eukprot:3986944-Pyramimonas_sp.AAC.1
MTSFYGSSCANNGKDALNTPCAVQRQRYGDAKACARGCSRPGDTWWARERFRHERRTVIAHTTVMARLRRRRASPAYPTTRSGLSPTKATNIVRNNLTRSAHKRVVTTGVAICALAVTGTGK